MAISCQREVSRAGRAAEEDEGAAELGMAESMAERVARYSHAGCCGPGRDGMHARLVIIFYLPHHGIIYSKLQLKRLHMAKCWMHELAQCTTHRQVGNHGSWHSGVARTAAIVGHHQNTPSPQIRFLARPPGTRLDCDVLPPRDQPCQQHQSKGALPQLHHLPMRINQKLQYRMRER